MKTQSLNTMLIALAAIALATAPIYAQPPVVLWTQTFGGDEDDDCRSLQRTADGGYIMAGYTESFGAGGADVYLVKTDAQGNMEWEATYGGSNDNYCESVQQTTDGGYILIGTTGTYPAWDVYLVKTDAIGNEMWSKTFNFGSDDYGNDVQQTEDGAGEIVPSCEYRVSSKRAIRRVALYYCQR